MECAFPQSLGWNTWQSMRIYITQMYGLYMKMCHAELLRTVAFCLPPTPVYSEPGDHSDLKDYIIEKDLSLSEKGLLLKKKNQLL